MNYEIIEYSKEYLHDIWEIWNEAIDEGLTLPWKEPLEEGKVEYIISTQIECFCAMSGGKCVGFLSFTRTLQVEVDILQMLFILSKDNSVNKV